MDAKDLLGKTLTTVTTTYRNGAEHISFTFTDSTTGEKVAISITPERGGDLWETLRKK